MAEILAPFAVAFRQRPMESKTDKGGKASKKAVEVLRSRGDLRIRAKSAEGGSKITGVLDGGGASASAPDKGARPPSSFQEERALCSQSRAAAQCDCRRALRLGDARPSPVSARPRAR